MGPLILPCTNRVLGWKPSKITLFKLKDEELLEAKAYGTQTGWTTGSGSNQGTHGMAEALLWEDPAKDTCLPAGDSLVLLAL